MNENLKAEKRPDRNGNIVTRWVRSFSRKASSQPLPAPSLEPKSPKAEPRLSAEDAAALRRKEWDEESAKRDRKRQAIKQVVSEVESLVPYNANAEDYEHDTKTYENVDFLLTHTPDLMHKALQAAHSNSSIGKGLVNLLKSSSIAPDRDLYYGSDYDGRYREPSEAEVQDRVLSIRQTVITHEMVSRLSESGALSGSDATENGKYAIGNDLTYATRTVLVRKRDKVFTDEEIEAVSTLLFVERAHEENMFAVNKIHNTIYDDKEADINYLASRINEVRGIVPLLAERGSCDRELVQRLLDAPTKALIDGEL